MRREDINEPRFWAKVEKGEPDECWRWKGAITSEGYGVMKVSGRMIGAHRLSYAIRHGETPRKASIMHVCDSTWCVNPAHLIAGTHADNMRDCNRKKRRGEARKKLRPSDVWKIREMLGEGRKQGWIAEQFGVSRPAINAIATGRSWDGLK